jgi:DNA-directed RNA polymerase specialized sigma24 family protein
MDSPPPTKKGWSLTGEAFAKFLAFLDADLERAGEKYEELRCLLVKFFHWRGATFPEERADQAIDRVARRIDEGEVVHDLMGYCYGVARLLFLETLKGPESRREPLDDIDLAVTVEEGEEVGLLQSCMADCLRALPAESREVILQYYRDERRAKIDHRKALATRLGIPLNALRSRAQRLRDRLGECVKRCLKKK